MILVILRLIVAIATAYFGSETKCLAMPVGTHLQSMFTPVPPQGLLFASTPLCSSLSHFLPVDYREISTTLLNS